MIIEQVFRKAIMAMPELGPEGGWSKTAKFEFGPADDLGKFIERYGEDHYPLIWLTPTIVPSGDFEVYFPVEAVVNICTRETRKELLNTERTDLTYEQVLLPVWESMRKQLRKTRQVAIDGPSISRQFTGDYKEGELQLHGEIWDVLTVTFTGLFYPELTCKNG